MDERPGIVGAHECGADKDGVNSGRQHASVINRSDAGLGDEDLVWPGESVQLSHTADVDLGGPSQVARINAHHRRPRGDRATESCWLVRLDKNAEPQFAGARNKAVQRRLVERLSDEKDGICTRGTRLDQLVFVNDYVLAQDRDVDRLANCDKVFDGSAPMTRLREDRDGGCAGGRVRKSQRRDVDALAKGAKRGRAPLDLGDHCEARVSTKLPERLREPVTERGHPEDASRPAGGGIANERRQPDRPTRGLGELALGHASLGSRHIDSPLRDNLLEEVAHTVAASAAPMRWLVATKRTSTSFAAPLSIVTAASLAPSRMSCA